MQVQFNPGNQLNIGNGGRPDGLVQPVNSVVVCNRQRSQAHVIANPCSSATGCDIAMIERK